MLNIQLSFYVVPLPLWSLSNEPEVNLCSMGQPACTVWDDRLGALREDWHEPVQHSAWDVVAGGGRGSETEQTGGRI